MRFITFIKLSVEGRHNVYLTFLQRSSNVSAADSLHKLENPLSRIQTGALHGFISMFFLFKSQNIFEDVIYCLYAKDIF